MTTAEHSVVIAGGGPTGMMLAAELAIAGVDVVVVERRETAEVIGSRGSGLHARTVEIFDQRGIADRFISQGTKHPAVHVQTPLDITDFPTRHNYTLGLWQSQIERILAEWLDELGVSIHRGIDVTGFTQDDSGVDVALSDGRTLRAAYLVGCDGGRSVIRKTAGIEFPGWDATISWIIAEVETTDEPKWGFHENALGRHAIGKGDSGIVRLVMIEQQLPTEGEPTLRDVSTALVAVYGTDFGAHSPKYISRFSDMTRQAAAYRDRRVLLAGDAAHVHPPLGGQGLNIGVQDAVNLGWKLAQVVQGTSRESLLDTYHAERHPVAARVLRNTMAQVALGRTDDRSKALAEYAATLVRMDEPRRKIVAEISGLGVRYDLGVPYDLDAERSPAIAQHPQVGRRMPDLDVTTRSGTIRVFSLLQDARPVLLNLGNAGGLDIAPWADRVKVIDATFDGTWELPVIGTVPTPGAVLIRPDGYVAWAGDGTRAGLTEALTTWFGPPVA